MFRCFLRDVRGSVAPMFALSIIPIVGLVGAAVDYGLAANARTKLQTVLDATALFASQKAVTQTAAQLQATTETYFNAQFNNTAVKNGKITATYSSVGGSSLSVFATGALDTHFMGLLGVSSMDIGTSSTVQWGNSRLRVALVLDTTGSMADAGKIGALKIATKNLLNQLQAAATVNGDVYVSITPFSKNVNLGGANFNAGWIDWTSWEAEPAVLKASKPNNWSSIGPGSSCPFSAGNDGFRCTTGPANGSANASTIPSSGAYEGYICPSVDTGGRESTAIGMYYNGCYDSLPTTTPSTKQVCSGSSCSCGGTSNCWCSGNGRNTVCAQTVTATGAPYTHRWITNSRSTWNGCVTDRGASNAPSEDFDRKVTAPSAGTPASLFPAEQNLYCSPEVMGLSYDWSTMKRLVDNLYPLGATNQPIGLVWGWQSLVGGGPLTAPSKDPAYTYNEVIILMSDGLNTLNRWYGNGSITNTSVNKRMYETSTLGTCVNVKAAGVTIYAIHVNTGGDPTSTLLQNCASSSDKFWLVKSGSELDGVFQQIGSQLSRLRIAK